MSLGLLLTMTEPPPAMEEEFNAWYDDEHLAERLAIPGFRSAKRWVADVPAGQGKYLGTYELDSPHVLNSEAYLQRFKNQTPWSKRCLSKCVVFRRWATEQLVPGDAMLKPDTTRLWLGLGDVKPAVQAPTILFHDPAGKPRYVMLVPDQDSAALPGWEFRLYRAYTKTP
jgi:hypothetical protein